MSNLSINKGVGVNEISFKRNESGKQADNKPSNDENLKNSTKSMAGATALAVSIIGSLALAKKCKINLSALKNKVFGQKSPLEEVKQEVKKPLTRVLKEIKQRGDIIVETEVKDIQCRNAVGVPYTRSGKVSSFYKIDENGKKVWLKDKIIYERGGELKGLDSIKSSKNVIEREDRLANKNTIIETTRTYDKDGTLSSINREESYQIYPGMSDKSDTRIVYDFKNKKYSEISAGTVVDGRRNVIETEGKLIPIDQKTTKRTASDVINGHKIEITSKERTGPAFEFFGCSAKDLA